jgi:hypothetical protein
MEAIAAPMFPMSDLSCVQIALQPLFGSLISSVNPCVRELEQPRIT